jgi:hypothetical protein
MHLIHKDTFVEPPHVPVISRTRGQARVVVKDLMGNVVQDSGWHSNAFLDFGRAVCWDVYRGMVVGSSNAATNLAQTDLASPLVTFTKGFTDVYNDNEGPPNYRAIQDVKGQWSGSEFVGGAGGTIREVGLTRNNSGSQIGELMTRVVVPDMVVTTDNVVDVFYRLYAEPDLTQFSGQEVINGITYDWISRMCSLRGETTPGSGIYLGSYDKPTNGMGLQNGGSIGSSVHQITSIPLCSVDEFNTVGINNTTTFRESIGQDLDSATVDTVNRIQNVLGRADLARGLWAGVGGIRSVYMNLKTRRLSGNTCAIGYQYTAVDGPNPGEGIQKTDKQWINFPMTLSWDAVQV